MMSRRSVMISVMVFAAQLSLHAGDMSVSQARAQRRTFAETAMKRIAGEEVKLELGSSQNIPCINGKPVNLYPKKVFDSPYLDSDHGSGVVTIKKDDKKLVLDFNEK